MNIFERGFMYLARHGFLNWMPDRPYLEICYKIHIGKKLNLKNPKSFNEKLQWLKLYDRKPEYTKMVDKYEVKKYVADRIGEEYIIPTIGVWDKVEDIDFDKLPDQFVLKCTHDSGGLIICKDKSKLDIEEAKKKLKHFYNRKYFYLHREWPYKNVKPRIIAEKFMVDESGTELKDYKFFCFNGEPKALYIATDRGIDTRFDFYDMEFHHMDFTNGHKNSDKSIKKPAGFDEMVKLSKILSKSMPHVRIDFYDINGKVYFGEITFYHMSGFAPFKPEKYDKMFGEWINLPQKTN